MEIAGTKEVNTRAVGFQIGPRLNAAGRISHASEALELLLCEDEAEAVRLAQGLQDTNKRRQEISEKMFKEAKREIKGHENDPVLFVVKEGWNPGVVGLIAGKLTSEFHRPAYVVGSHDGKFVGSGRGIPGVDVTKPLRAAGEHLDKFGGHPEACGFSASSREKLELAMEAMREYMKTNTDEKVFLKSIAIDAEIRPSQLDWSLVEALEFMHPTGNGNREPVICLRSMRVTQIKLVGATKKHMKLGLQARDGTMFNAIGFYVAEKFSWLEDAMVIDIVFEPSRNEWNGRKEIQLLIKDIQQST